MIAKSHCWRKTALATAAAAVLGLWSVQVSALSLGRIAVLSALGEPLRAEIDIPEINAEEAASLKASVASPDTFRAAGMDYNPTLGGLQLTLQRRADGRPFLRVSSDRVINDPYLDLIVEANWSSGRIVRDYTMLFDPPNLRQTQAAPPTLPQASPAPTRTAAPAAPVSPPATAPASAAANKPPSVPSSPRTPAAAPATETASKTAATTDRSQITVKPGDTASKLVATHRPAGISLDQMLVAMLRANPEAFIGGNINRLRSGAVVSLPGAEDAQATSADEARQIVQAQSKDFDEFRRKLAGSAPLSPVATADRRAAGKVEAQVDDKKTSNAAPDKLTLSKGAVQAKGNEDKIAKERSAQEAANRAEELSKNIAELNKLSAAAAPAGSAPAAATPTQPPATATAATPTLAPVTAAVEPAATPAAPAPSAPLATTATAAPVTAMPEPSFLDELLDNPLMPAAAAALIALLAGLGFYRARQRKQAAQMDSSFLESKLQSDSFFGASGGQRVDTQDGTTGSSMVYSPSQLDAADDVDPVAEADVYLAYGRDLQAEEILKEALRAHPDRLAIHLKLLEIYAKRRDSRNFDALAADVQRLTGAEGTDWERVCELGRSLDTNNTLYQSGDEAADRPATDLSAETPSDSAEPPSTSEAEADNPASAATVDSDAEPAPQDTPPGLDLDLDFSLENKTDSTATTQAAAPEADLDLDLDLPEITDQDPPAAAQAQTTDDAAATDAAPQAAADADALEFDLGTLSLDLESTEETPSGSSDPLATKLALAEEFSAIGDTDGARALIEEIIAEASGEMKAKAEAALSQLN